MVRRFSLPLIALGAVLGLVVLYAAGALRFAEDEARFVLLPVARAFASVGQAVRTRAPFADVSSLQKQVHDLESRVETLSVDYVRLRTLEDENATLRTQAKFLSTSGFDFVGARVIARNLSPRSSTALIDRGTRDGLGIGMPVVVGEGVLVGKIVSVSERVATVMFVSDPRSRLAAAPVGAMRLYGMIQGQGNGVAELTLVPQSEPLAHDDVVVTAGTEEKIPANLPIASVEDVQGKSTDPFKTATLQPLARVERLELVSVLRPAALRPQ